MEYRDYYAVLDVPRNATQAEIKRAYKKCARKYHPDVSKAPDAEKKFILIKEAYEALKDPKKRAAYDRLGDNWQTGQEFTAPPDWERNFHFSSDSYTQGDAAAFSDFLNLCSAIRLYARLITLAILFVISASRARVKISMLKSR